MQRSYTTLAATYTPTLTISLLHHFAGKGHCIVFYRTLCNINVIFLTFSASKRLHMNCGWPVHYRKTQNDVPRDATARNIDNKRLRTMQKIRVHLTLTLQNTLHHVIKVQRASVVVLNDREPCLKMQWLNPSVIKYIQKNRQHENKRHQRNYDVRIRNNYSRRKKNDTPPTSTFVQKHTSSMSTLHTNRMDHISRVHIQDTSRQRSTWRWMAEYDYKNTVFWDVTQCRLVEMHLSSGATKRLHIMRAASISEMSVNFYHITWHHTPKDNNLDALQ